MAFLNERRFDLAKLLSAWVRLAIGKGVITAF
jgi:hypothetical protein